MSEDDLTRSNLQLVYNVERILDAHTHPTGMEGRVPRAQCFSLLRWAATRRGDRGRGYHTRVGLVLRRAGGLESRRVILRAKEMGWCGPRFSSSLQWPR
jgi:hypothetical protein